MVSPAMHPRRRNGRHADVSASRHARPGYTARTVPIAVIAFDFDPLLRLGDGLVVRWQTVALAAVDRRLPGRRRRPRPARGVARGRPAVHRRRGGAGRRDRRAYRAARRSPPRRSPAVRSSLLDPAIGGLELGLGVVGGVLSAAYVAMLLGAPVGRWATTLALPLLVALGAGKLAMVLGGSGQGSPLDAAWATAYLGPGPWGSLAPGAAVASVAAVRRARPR